MDGVVDLRLFIAHVHRSRRYATITSSDSPSSGLSTLEVFFILWYDRAMQKELIVAENEAGQRLDVFCVAKNPTTSRSAIQKGIKSGETTVNGRQVKPGYVVREKDVVKLAETPSPPTIAEASVGKHPLPASSPEIKIIDEDRDWVVINKPAGMAVHGEHGAVGENTVASWFIQRYPTSFDVGEDIGRPGIVHRLDKDTSGVMILARTSIGYKHLLEQFKRRRAQKEYIALVFGSVGEPKGRIVRALKRSARYPLRRTIDETGKEAITEWRFEKNLGKYTLLRVYPLTGRMHQIRAHLHFLGFPIVGDQLYTFKRQKSPAGVTRQLLHAEKLHIILPNDTNRTFTVPLPDDFQRVIDELLRRKEAAARR
jgi:23S rRNA pseudouridine1911/1915/1917 synthase